MNLFQNIAKKFNLYNLAKNNFKEFKSIPKEQRQIVFYAETRADWTFIGPIYDYIYKYNKNIIKITSDINDDSLKDNSCLYIGSGSTRTIFFRTLDSDRLVLTLTDLNSYHLKKSMYPVHYYYIFHSLISTHRAYKEGAFNGYSTIFCAGNYHFDEIKKTEEIYSLDKKILEKCGYPKLDYLISQYEKYKSHYKKNKYLKVLIAPSWGPSAINQKQLDILINELLTLNIEVVLRLHPMTLKNEKSIKDLTIKKYGDEDNFTFDENIDSIKTVIESDFLISEWSGTAIEFAFTKLRPVFFINTEKKIRNKNWGNLGLDCFEEIIRDKIGYIIKLDRLKDVSKLINNAEKDQRLWEKRIYDIRNKYIFNIGKSIAYASKVINK